MKRLSIKFIIDARRCDAFGRTQIFCKVRLDRDDVNTYPTSQVCFPQDWDAAKQRVNTRGMEAEAANMVISAFELKVREAYAAGVLQQNLCVAQMRAALKTNESQHKGGNAFLAYVGEYIALQRRKQGTPAGLSNGTLRSYDGMRKALTAFIATPAAQEEGHTGFNNGAAFCKAFFDYMIATGKTTATAKLYLSKLLIVGEYLVERGVWKASGLVMPKIKYVQHSRRKFGFKFEHWQALQTYKPRNRDEHIVQLMALFQGYTGLAISDLLRLMWADIHDAEPMRVIIQHRKKNFRGDQAVGKAAVIPVLRQAEDILTELKSLQIPQFVVCPRLTPETYNRKLGRIAAMLDIPAFTSHDLRKAFANYVCKRAGISGRAISSSLGHSGTGTTEHYYLKDDLAQMLGEFVVVQNYLNQQEAM